MGTLPAELGNLPNLSILDVRNNRLSDPLPPELDNLRALKNLWRSSNRLVGSIPPELGDLVNLRCPYLEWNQLTGSIAPELGNLSLLRNLFPESNRQTGLIPRSFPQLQSISSFHFHQIQLNAGLCASPEDEFQAWQSMIQYADGPTAGPPFRPSTRHGLTCPSLPALG